MHKQYQSLVPSLLFYIEDPVSWKIKNFITNLHRKLWHLNLNRRYMYATYKYKCIPTLLYTYMHTYTNFLSYLSDYDNCSQFISRIREIKLIIHESVSTISLYKTKHIPYSSDKYFLSGSEINDLQCSHQPYFHHHPLLKLQ